MKRFYFIAVYLLLHGFVYSQADLKVLNFTVDTHGANPIHVGQNITGTYTVQNIGNATAGKSHTAIYITPLLLPATRYPLGVVSLESIAAGITTTTIKFNYIIPYSITSTDNYTVVVSLNDDSSIPEPNKANNTASAAEISVDYNGWASQNLPYPVIFIHGLNSNNDTWNVLIDSLKKNYGWGYGGNMNFSLNYDGIITTSNKNTDYYDYTNVSSLQSNDYYTVNFDVDKYGVPLNDSGVFYHISNYEQGNQSAIVKQGLAIRDAINHVLVKTGKDKVILVGHSMGGLAAREYLQNENLWYEPNINHHVAKLLTVGTPHGGSNFGEVGLAGNLLAAFKALDLNSEAVRDLRTNYNFLSSVSLLKGAYLFGGNENTVKSYISNLGFAGIPPYYNYDFDCNGNIGDNITGLNNKILPDLPYSCIIGKGDPLGGDGVVSEESANLNKYFANINADEYSITKINSANPLEFVLHTDLTNEFRTITQGLDEPNYLQYAYNIDLNKLYFGNFTLQSIPYNRDDDNYSVNVLSNGKLNIQVFNIPTSAFTISVYSATNLNLNNPVAIKSFNSNGAGYLNVDVPVSAGKYYVVLSGNSISPDTWKSQYAFQLGFTAVTPNYGSCFTNLTATTGTFSDGSGASNYANNANCSWLINPTGVSSITLRFNNFNTEAINDVVNVYDGNDNTYPLLGQFSGNTIPASITSTGSNMFVQFITNGTVNAAGWDATYTSTVSQNPVSIPSYTTGYKYWFDGDITNSVTVTQNFSNTTPINSLLQTPSNFNNGFHTVAVMVKQSNNQWSVPVTTNFYYATSGGAASYEYWYDSNYVNKQIVQITDTNNLVLTNQMLNATALTNGYHQFNVRYKPNGGSWSLVQSSNVFKQGNATVPASQVTEYEYWYDTSYTNKQNVTVTNAQDFTLTNQLLGAATLANGFHQFNFRFKNNTSFWSAVQSQNFFKQGNATVPASQVAQYEYWFDNNYASKITAQTTGSSDLTISSAMLDASALSNGFHQYSYRFQSNTNLWSSIQNGFVFKRGNDVNATMDVKKLRYWFDTSFSNQTEIITTGQNGIINNLVDCSNLTIGKHAINYQTMDNGNVWSSILVDSFTLIRSYLVSGKIVNPNNLPIPRVKVKQNTTDSINTASDGAYSFIVPAGNYTFTPSKNNDIVKSSGVNVLDVLLIQKHITAAQLLNTPYKLIAANVNSLNGIDILDVIYTKRLILGIDTTFPGNKLWAFVDSSYVFPDPTNPGTYNNNISISNISSNQINKTFIGVKLGDVNLDLVPSIGVNRIYRQGIPVKLYHDTVYTSTTDKQVRLSIKVKNFKELLGMQFTLSFNKNVMEFAGIENNKMAMNYGFQQAKNGRISFIWADSLSTAKTLPDGTVLFDLIFNKLATLSEEHIDINSEIADAVAYDIAYTPHDVQKGNGLIVENKVSLYTYDNLEVNPNPSNGLIKLKITSSEDKYTTLLLFDVYGKEIMRKKVSLITGINEFLINLNEPRIIMQGTYFLKAIGLKGKNTQSIIISR